MPRKTTGMPFEVYPSSMKNSNGENYLYVRPMQGKSVTINDLSEYCTQNSGLPRNTLTSVFNYFITACAQFLAEGNRIETPMGSFAPRLALKKGITDPGEVGVDDVMWRGVEFQPSKKFMNQIYRWSRGFNHAPGKPSRHVRPTDAQLLQTLDRSIEDNKGHTTIRSFSSFSGLSLYSARKYLDSLCQGDNPLLERRQYGRAFTYTKASPPTT